MIKTKLKGLWHRVAKPRTILMLAMVMWLGMGSVFAAEDPFQSAATTITNYGSSVQKLMYAIAAVISIVGAFNIYHKMSNGDQDVKKTIMLTLGGAIAMVALATALPAMFGHTF